MYYSVNNINLYIKEEGLGEPALLFLHFWGGSADTWNGVTGILKHDFRCISYDHRGWGRSDKPASGYSIPELAQDTLALVKALDLQNYILIGHSMGGKVAQYVAAQKPDGLQKLVLVAPSPSLPTIPPAEILEGMRSAYTSLENINATIDHVFKAGDIGPDLRERLIKDIQSHNEPSRLGWTDIALQENVSAGITQIAVPTLIIAGENDLIDPPQRLEAEVKALIPRSEMTIINGAGHLIMLQKPEQVAALIKDFI